MVHVNIFLYILHVDSLDANSTFRAYETATRKGDFKGVDILPLNKMRRLKTDETISQFPAYLCCFDSIVRCQRVGWHSVLISDGDWRESCVFRCFDLKDMPEALYHLKSWQYVLALFTHINSDPYIESLCFLDVFALDIPVLQARHQ